MMFLLAVTVVSLIIALVMSVVAWRAAGEEKRRSDARVAALAADIHADDLDLRDEAPREPAAFAPRLQAPVVSAPVPMFAASTTPDEHPVESDGLFGSASAPVERGPRFAIVGGVAVLVGAIAVVILMLSGGSHNATASQSRRADAVDTPAAEASTSDKTAAATPLELVALGHDRDGDRLTVRGIVRNPVSGGAVDRLTAVVFMFDRDGGFLGSGRATVETPALDPGGESAFVVTIPGASSVGRYRVSFRTDDHIVPHVDRREHTLARS